ncbi:MAG: hypothetical protein KAZ71_09170 [Bacteroidia bacterium]|nr:hypothetical protein [Bacteroidia bacterium]
MKNLFFLFLSIIMISSCSKDKTDPIPDRNKFLASYSVIQNCPSGNSNYDISITTSAENESTILISNFLGLGAIAKATVSGTNLSIPNQIVNIQGNSVTINSGSGSLNGSLLTMAYGYSFNNQTENCSMNCTKK